MPVSPSSSPRSPRRPRPQPGPARAARAPRARTAGWWLRRIALGLTLLALATLLGAWGVLQWGILPRVNQWRPQVEARVSRALGVTVQIAAIDVGAGYWRRVLTLRDVALKDARGEEALRLPEVQVVLSPASLLPRSLTSWTPRFHQVLIDRPQLEARRAPDGRIFVAGLEVGRVAGSQAGGNSRAADWLFSQGRFAIRGGSLSWSDEKRGAPVLALTAVDIEVRNSLNHHDIRIEATPPESWGTRVLLHGDFREPLLGGGVLASEGDWRRWRGTLHAELPRAELHALRQHMDLPFDLQEGHAGVRVRSDVEGGRIDAATIDVLLEDVQLKFGPALEPLRVQRLATQLDARRRRPDDAEAARAGERIELTAHGLNFATGDGVAWPASDLFVAMQRDADGAIAGGEMTAQRIDLAVLSQLARRVPLSEGLRKWIEAAKPQGLIQPFKVSWTGPMEAPQRYTASGRATALSAQGMPGEFAAAPASGASGAANAASSPAAMGPPLEPAYRPPLGRPGLRNGTLDFTASEGGGQARISIERGAVELPGVFEEPVIALDRVEAQLNWRFLAATTPDAASGLVRPLEVQVREARFANADMQGELKGTWRTGKGGGVGRGGQWPGEIDLEVQISRANIARTARYLPYGIPEGARRYVADAVRAGQSRNISARVRGDLANFPFGRGDGEFRMRAQLEDATFAYVPASAQQPPAWPAFTQLRGELVVDRTGLEIRNAQARVAGVGSGQYQLTGVRGGVKDFGHEPVLVLEGQGRGTFSDLAQYLEATPIGGWIGHPLARSTARGDAALQLALRLPLHDLSTSTVRGQVQLAGNDLRFTPDTPLLSNVRARIDFTETGFSLHGAQVHALGGDASIEGGTQKDGSTRISVTGSATAEGVRGAPELGLPARLAAHASGSTAYKLNLGFMRGQAELQLSSTLAGLATTLPAPFGKSAEQALPLRVEMRPLSAPREPARDQVRVELGTLVQAQIQRDLSGPQARIVRGGVGVGSGEAPPAGERGLELSINLPQASLDAWRSWADGPGAPLLGDGAPAGGAGGGSGAVPERIHLRAAQLMAFSRKLTGVNAIVTRTPREREAVPWVVQVEADQLQGRIEYLPAQAAAGTTPATEARVYARLARLSLPQSDASAVESLLDQNTAVPALDVVVDDFELRGRKLGRLEIEALNRGGEGAAREWQLAKFNLTTPEAQLTATGSWSAVNVIADPATRIAARRRTAMNFQLHLADSGATLNRLGLGGTLRGGKGRLTGDLSWFGSPLSPDYPSLSGTIKIALDAGQFLKAEPGAARLLGVLSLQALPRRLLLDFRDVFQEGFSFDNLGGDVSIAQGVASTRNLRIRGVQALVLMEGSADIARETQDLHVWVVPEINAGTASLAYAIINPAVGLGTFLGQLFLRKPLIEANTREFRITGAWADPKVDRVERTPPKPAPGPAADVGVGG